MMFETVLYLTNGKSNLKLYFDGHVFTTACGGGMRNIIK
jgi:hypothetical protein